MKKYLLKIGLFFLIIVIIDALSGKVFDYLFFHAKGGDAQRNNYICNETNEDMLIFGSSRAIHHYNPIILSDSLGLSCYNCGQRGNGSILNYGYFQLIQQRYCPQILIYDVIPGYDLLVGEDNHKYLGWLRPFYDRTGITDIFYSVDKMEIYKMQSQMYRYNSKFIQILIENIHPIYPDIKGFRPMNEEMDTMKITRRVKKEIVQPVFDSLKISYLNRLVEENDDTQIIFVVSPFWDGADTIPFQPVREICKERNIPFIDFSNDPKYVHHNEYFKDGAHLNARGADEFTRDLVHVLKERGLIEQNGEKK